MKQKFKCLFNNDEPRQLQIEDMIVEIKYSSSSKKINECMLNILKQKKK